tara:strand:- start:2984 stop:6649 length:3666 start_codon:yes stop_codon:yes gene_type:complete
MEAIPASAEQWLAENDSPAARAAFDKLYGTGQADTSLNVTPEEPEKSWSEIAMDAAADFGEGLIRSPISVATGLVEGGITNPYKFATQFTGDVLFDLENKDNKSLMDRFSFLSGDEIAARYAKGDTSQQPLTEQAVNYIREGKIDWLGVDVGKDETVTGNFATEGSKFVGALVGVGKVVKLAKPLLGLKTATTTTRAGTATAEIAKSAAAIGLAYEGKDGRLTDFLVELGVPDEYVIDYLKSDPNDSDIEGRFKTVLEDTLLFAPLAIVVGKLVKAVRRGDTKEAEELVESVERLDNALQQVDEVRPSEPTALNNGTQLELFPDKKPTKAAKPAQAADETTIVNDVDANQLDLFDAATVGEKSISKQMADAVDVDFVNNTPKTPDVAFKVTRDQQAKIAQKVDDVKAGDFVDMGWRSPKLINSMDEVDAEITAYATVLAKQFKAKNQTRTEKGWKQEAGRIATNLAEMTGRSTNEVLDSVKGFDDPSSMAAQLMARENYALSLSNHIVKLAKMIDDQRLKPDAAKITEAGYKSLDEAKIDVMKLRELAANVIAMAQGQRSDIARAMRAMQVIRTGNPRISKIIAQEGGDLIRDSDALISRLAAEDYASPLTKIQEIGTARRLFDMANKFRINAMLAGVGTQLVNTISSGTNVLLIPMQQLVGGILTSYSKAGRRSTLHAIKTYQGMLGGFVESIKATGTVLKTGDSVLDVSNSKIEIPQGSLTNSKAAKVVDAVVTIPTRFLLSVDEFFKQSAYRGKVFADAHFETILDGTIPSARKGEIKRKITSKFDENGGAADPDALLQAQRSTFTEPLERGSLGYAIQQMAINSPLVRIILPFVRTPINILSQGFQQIPAVGMLSKRWRQDIAAGGTRRHQALGRQAIGTAMMGWGYMMAEQGRITGGGPRDPQVRKEWLKSNQPYCFRSVDEETGEIIWTPYQRLEPFTYPLALVADFQAIIHDQFDEDNPDKVEWAKEASFAVLHAFMENTINKTFTQGIAGFVDALNDKDGRATEKFVNSTVGSFVPNIIPQVQNDQHQREIRGVFDALRNRIGMNNDIDRRRNYMGEIIFTNKNRMNPFADVVLKPDPLQNELTRLSEKTKTGGFGLPTSTKIDSYRDLKDLMYSPTQSYYDKWIELSGEIKINGKTLRQSMTNFVESDRYDRMQDPDGDNTGPRVDGLKKIGSLYRLRAENILKRESPEFRQLLDDKRKARRDIKRFLDNPR